MNFQDVLKSVNDIEKRNKNFDTTVSIAFLGNITINGIVPYLKYFIYKDGIKPIIEIGDYNIIEQYFIESSGFKLEIDPDIIVLSLFPDFIDSTFSDVDWDNENLIIEIITLYDFIRSKTNALILINPILPPFYSEIGIASSSDIKDKIVSVKEVNNKIYGYMKKHSAQFFFMDWERMVRILGEKESIDYRLFYMAKAPFKPSFYGLLASEISKVVRAFKGKSKKCLVLDCDNTLWGGIIGEDGIDGIKLDASIYPGKAYYDFQKNVVKLYKRGIMIALCSKNNESDVFEVLENHESSLIKKEHLVAWKINWNNKADNLIDLANELNIGIDSIVFVDDNPIEINLIKETLPMVKTIQVPKNLYNYPNCIFKDGLFDTLSINKDDLQRTKMYKSEVKRKSEKNNYVDMEAYVKALKIELQISCVSNKSLPRVAQLTQKTNQFNLTTKRYTENQISYFVENDNYRVYSVSAEDKYGELGITGVMILFVNGSTLIIDSLLLSCRVLGRMIEDVFVSYCLNQALREFEVLTIKTKYIPTKKNSQVERFWEKFGFSVLFTSEDGVKNYFCKTEDLKLLFHEFINVK